MFPARSVVVTLVALVALSCQGDVARGSKAADASADATSQGGGPSGNGGAPDTGGRDAAGGAHNAGGAVSAGGRVAAGGAVSAGGRGAGGAVSAGGRGAGGAVSAGGRGAGGAVGMGGRMIDGGAGDSTTPARHRYRTDFLLTESPISEGGAWRHTGLDWTLVNTSNGMAWGTQAGSGAYDDSYAYLSGFSPDQSGSAVIHLATLDPAVTHEVEILLRWSDDAHDARGYECNLAWNGGYAEIVRWNGKLGDFTYLDRSGAPAGVHQGDTFSAKIVGNVITSYLNGVQIATATDATYADGNPGVGLWRGSGAPPTLRDYGFESYDADSLGP